VRTGARKVTTWESPVVVAPWHSPTSMRRSSDGRPLALNESSSDLEVRRLFSPLAPWSGGRAESTGSARPGRSALAPALATFRSSRCGRHCVWGAIEFAQLGVRRSASAWPARHRQRSIRLHLCPGAQPAVSALIRPRIWLPQMHPVGREAEPLTTSDRLGRCSATFGRSLDDRVAGADRTAAHYSGVDPAEIQLAPNL